MDNGITYMVLVLLNCLLSMIFEIFEGGQLMSEVSGVEEPVYLAYYDEDNFLTPHYQSLRKINKINSTGNSVTFASPTLTSTRNLLPAKFSTGRKRSRSPGGDPVPVIKLRRMGDSWTKVSLFK